MFEGLRGGRVVVETLIEGCEGCEGVGMWMVLGSGDVGFKWKIGKLYKDRWCFLMRLRG